jgi:DNA replication protein DnaC
MSHFFIELFRNSYLNSIQMTLFKMIKTDNIIIDSLLSTFLMAIIGCFINYVYESRFQKQTLSWRYVNDLFYKKNVIILEGKKSFTTSSYAVSNLSSSTYSDRFKAVWSYIIQSIDKNEMIYQIKETITSHDSLSYDHKKKTLDIFIVYQNKHFLIDENIYAYTQVNREEDNDKKENNSTKIDIITIEIYSYVLSLAKLKEYVDNITTNYLSSIKNNRTNKRFIYFLDQVTYRENESRFNCWREDIFESARTFNNIFFDGKQNIINKLDYFIKNKDWYDEKGIPYTLGIGLHGPPGTGKTSLIKAIANYTQRHIVVISPKLIKTKQQLEHFFFEDSYNEDNEKGSINFNNKIIVFEDIDCIGDLVLERKNIKPIIKPNEELKVTDMLKTMCELNEENNQSPITLDDILNLWDGIRETPGRIIIISSNKYDKLDAALIRPGRIDISHELSNASHQTIREIFMHLFGEPINETELKSIKEYLYSPAEIINIYVSNKEKILFMKRLLTNKKI